MAFRLTVLGSVQAFRDGQDVGWIPAQRLRTALLVHLALEGTLTRDQLLAMFWPEQSDERARHALRQVLYTIRQALGDEAVIADGETLRLVADATCDAMEFADAVERGDFAAAVALYRGPFLDGQYLSETPAFESWVDRQRGRLQRLNRRAQRGHIETLRARGATVAAIEAARRWAELEPLEDEAHLRLIELLAWSGDRAGALHQYDIYSRAIAAEEMEPLAEIQEIIARMRSAAGSAARAVAAHHAAAQPPPTTAPGTTGRRPSPWGSRLKFGTLTAALLVLGAWSITAFSGDEAAVALDDGLVAVLPFRVSGADSTLSEGLLDLVAARLTGQGGPRAVYPGAIVRAWRDLGDPASAPTDEEARALARQAGARWLWRGSAVAAGGGLTLALAIEDVASGPLEPVRVEGSADSLPWLVERLTASALSRTAGEPEERVRAPMTTSLPALRSYLEGQQAMRRGDFQIAHDAFEAALALDTAFANAALGLVEAAGWVGGRADQAVLLANAARERLGPGDRALVDALLELHEVEGLQPLRRSVGALVRATNVAPDRAFLWHQLGDLYFHFGAWLGASDWTRSKAAFDRALSLDPLLAGTILHRFDIAAAERDTATARDLFTRYTTNAPDAELRAYFDWRMAVLVGDSVRLRAARDAIPTAARSSLVTIMHAAQADGVGLDDAERAGQALLARSARNFEVNQALSELYYLALNRGRPQEALEHQRALEAQIISSPIRHRALLRDALYADGDYDAAAARVADLARGVAEPDPAFATQYSQAICFLEEWRLWHGDSTAVAASLRTLEWLTEERRARGVHAPQSCAPVLESLRDRLRPGMARRGARPELRTFALDHLEDDANVYQLRLAHIERAAGNDSIALAAAQRVSHGLRTLGLAPARLIEARLAARAGLRDQAVAAYQHYLSLRADPEPVLVPQRDSARAELQRLQRD